MRVVRELSVLLLLFLACRKRPTVYVEPRTQLKFVLIPAGQFTMGSPATEPGRRGDEIPHRVRITRSFYLSATEVTQRQWLTVMEYNHSTFRGSGLDAPVEQVSWNEVQQFLRRLNEGHAATFRLPTEAEWEYACRAGTKTIYSVGDRLSPDAAN